MVLEKWNYVCLMAERMVNAVVLIWWRYLKYLQHKMQFALGQGNLAEFSAVGMEKLEC